MEEVLGGPLSSGARGHARTRGGAQLIESYYRQILTEGFFHADPHPGNVMWWDGQVWFLDFGMVGELGPEMREGLVLLMLAFWQEDAEFLAETLLMLAGDKPATQPRPAALPGGGRRWSSRYRHLPLASSSSGRCSRT